MRTFPSSPKQGILKIGVSPSIRTRPESWSRRRVFPFITLYMLCAREEEKPTLIAQGFLKK